MKVFYSDHQTLPLPEGHRFPASKYPLLREELLRTGVLTSEELCLAPGVDRNLLRLAHTEGYVDAILNGTVDSKIIRQIGLPWSQELVTRSLASVGGTVAASYEALESGIAGTLAGGTHHAQADQGAGYCVFNDIAVAALHLLNEHDVSRVAIIDLDVHQGNGNAAIMGGNRNIFIFSMHGEKNYPFRKVPSTLDIGLPDGTGDKEYLAALALGLEQVSSFTPEIVFYQGGVDPLKEDTLGRLSLTFSGLAERDRMVFQVCKENDIPIVLTMGGGYAKPIELTVQAHVQTYRMAKLVFNEKQGNSAGSNNRKTPPCL